MIGRDSFISIAGVLTRGMNTTLLFALLAVSFHFEQGVSCMPGRAVSLAPLSEFGGSGLFRHPSESVLMSEQEKHDFAAGEVVHDRDDEEPNDAIVVNVPPVPASEWDVRALEQTLAEANPDYPEDAQTVIVVFDETLAEYFERTDTTGELESQIPIAELAAEHVQFYAFPAPPA